MSAGQNRAGIGFWNTNMILISLGSNLGAEGKGQRRALDKRSHGIWCLTHIVGVGGGRGSWFACQRSAWRNVEVEIYVRVRQVQAHHQKILCVPQFTALTGHQVELEIGQSTWCRGGPVCHGSVVTC